MFSLIIPIYKNEENLPRLLDEMETLSRSFIEKLSLTLELVFVVDGSPDQCFALLQNKLSDRLFSSQLILHARNFGSFAAIRTGMQHAKGETNGVMAADLQEPPRLMLHFAQALQSGECDVVVGTRQSREDPFFHKLMSQAFWRLYRKLVIKDIPVGGVDVFACTRQFKDQLLNMTEARSSLIAQIYWLGARRREIPYKRQKRIEGHSSWTFRKKIDYMSDSLFSFTKIPISLMIRFGVFGTLCSLVYIFLVIISRVSGAIDTVGYATTVTLITLFGSLNLTALGIVGNYAWRAYENTKQRPLSFVQFAMEFNTEPDIRQKPAGNNNNE
ncbi:MAG: glycosyltransferase [Candidatus Electrothrix sp. AUS4]|nr:glycosyltransferase [Candidatus Electrothrix sp. AUS4]